MNDGRLEGGHFLVSLRCLLYMYLNLGTSYIQKLEIPSMDDYKMFYYSSMIPNTYLIMYFTIDTCMSTLVAIDDLHVYMVTTYERMRPGNLTHTK